MPEKTQNFEQNMATLDVIVQQLESGTLTLDESLKQYEQGVALIRACHDQLNSAQRKLELLTGLDAEGNEITQPMSDEVLDNEQKIKARSSRRGYKKSEPIEQQTDESDLFGLN